MILRNAAIIEAIREGRVLIEPLEPPLPSLEFTRIASRFGTSSMND